MRTTSWRRRPVSLYTRVYRRAQRRRFLGLLMLIAGAALAAVHLIVHLGRLHAVGVQDGLLGYPMAAALISVGFLLLVLGIKA